MIAAATPRASVERYARRSRRVAAMMRALAIALELAAGATITIVAFLFFSGYRL